MDSYPNPYSSPRVRQPTPRRRGRWLAVAIVVVLAGIYGSQHYSATHSLAHPLDFKAHASSADNADLAQQIDATIKSYPQVQTGVSVVNLQSGDQGNFGLSAPFTAASTTKLVTAAAFLHQVERGRYSLNDSLGDYTASWQLQQLIQESNNDSWQLFMNLLGGGQIQGYAQSIGLNSYNFNNNTITPANEAVLLKELYQGKLLNPAHTKLLLSYMQDTNDQQLIPAALPAGATVYQKYGELLDATGNYVHDAAIVSYKGHSFILTIYTDRPDLLDYPDRLNLIHSITKTVFHYETGS